MSSPVLRPAKRVLVYRLGTLGDTVIVLPALHLIQRAFPEAERRLLTSFPPAAKAPASSAVLEHTDLIHGYFRYNHGTRSARELLVLWWQLLRWRPQVLVYLNGARGIAAAKRDALFFRLCGIRELIGVPLTEDMQRCRPLRSAETSAGSLQTTLEHECSRLARNLESLGDAQLAKPGSWDLHITAAERIRADEALRPLQGMPFLAASIGTKMQSKDWGQGNWHDLVVRLAAEYPRYGLVLCGAREEAEASEAVASGWRRISRHPVVNLCGVLSPRESAAVFARAAVFLGHDSGPMHLAAAVQTPCVAVFSARNLPNVWFPYGTRHRVLYHPVSCQNCDLEVCTVEAKRCIRSISVDEVLGEVRQILRD